MCVCVYVCVQLIYIYRTSQLVLAVKNLPAIVGDERDMGSIPGLGRPPGVRTGTSL